MFTNSTIYNNDLITVIFLGKRILLITVILFSQKNFFYDYFGYVDLKQRSAHQKDGDFKE
jgi:hypothetical protein